MPPRLRSATVVLLAALLVVAGFPFEPPPATAQSPNCGVSVPALQNGSFELPANSANSVTQTTTPNSQLVWLNTAENVIEMWHQVFQGVSAYDGSQFVELNAFRPGTLYQDLVTIPGTQMVFSLAHKARSQDGETVIVKAGPPSGPLTEIDRYAADINGPERNGWTLHEGTYTVPSGQTTTRFAFESDGSTTTAPGSGNFLDAIEFTLIAGACDDTADATFGGSVDIPVLNNDIGAGLTVTQVGAVSPAAAGAATVAGDTVRFTPGQWSGIATIPYTVRDASGATSTADITVTVNPRAIDDTFDVTENRPQTLDVLANDAATGARVTIQQPPSNGTANVTPDGLSVAYTPGPGFTGVDTFTYFLTADPSGSTSPVATVTVTVDQNSDVAIQQGVAPSRIGIDQIFTYPLTISNNGPSTAVSPTITFSLPSGVSLVPGPNCSAGPPATCSISTLSDGGSYTFDPQFQGSTAGGGLDITATVSVSNDDPNPANDSVTQTLSIEASADLSVEALTSGGATPGGTTTFSFDIDNAGPSVATGNSVRIQLVPAADLVLPPTVQVGGTAATCTPPSVAGVFDCPVPDLASGGSTQVDVEAGVDPGATPGAIQLIAAIDSATFDPDTSNNAQAAGATVAPDVDLTITGRFDPAPAPSLTPGQGLLLVLDVTRSGVSDATDVVTRFTLPDGLTLSGPPPAGCTLGAGNVTCDIGTLTSGSSDERVFAVQIDTAVPGDVDVTATVSAAQPDANPADNDAIIAGPVAREADRSILVGGGTAPIAGRTDTLVVAVVNTGPADAPGTTVDIALPTVGGSNPAFVISTLPASCLGSTPTELRCSLDLPAGSSVNLVLPGEWATGALGDYTVTASALPPTGTQPVDPNPANDSSTLTVTVVEQADFAVSGSVSPQPLIPGDRADFSLTVENLGPSDAAPGATLTLPLPSGLTFASSSGGCAAGGPGVVCDIAALDAGDGVGIVVEVDVDPSFTGGLTTTASIAPPPGVTDPFAANDTVEITDTSFPTADLTVFPSATPIDAVPGASAGPTFTVRNLGPSDAPDSPFRVTLPTGYTFVSATGATCSPGGSPNEVLCAGGPLAAGDDVTATLTVDLPPGSTGTAQISAEVRDALPGQPPILTDPEAGNNAGSVQLSLQPASDLSIAGTGPATITPGTDVVWSVSVANGGPSDSASTTTTFTLPTGVAFGSATGASCTPTGNSVTCDPGPVAAGARATFDLVTRIDPSVTGTTVIAAEVTGPGFEPNPTDNIANLTAADVPLADLEITGTVAPASLPGSGQATWTFTVENIGPSNARGLVVDLVWPTAGVTPVSLNGSTCTVGTGAGSCNIGTLDAGAVTDVTLVADVDLGAGGTVDVTATASADQTDPTPADNTVDVALTVIATDVDIAVSGSVSPTTVAPGDQATWTFTVENGGPADATGVTASVTLPAGLTISSAVGGTCTMSADSATCDLDTIAAGTSTDLVIETSIADDAVGTLTVTIVGQATENDADPSNDRTSIELVVDSSELPATGFDADRLALTGLGLILLGWALAILASRRSDPA